MTGNRVIHFNTPHQTQGKPAKSRFGLRPQTKTARTLNPKEDDTRVGYANPGHGVNGESSN